MCTADIAFCQHCGFHRHMSWTYCREWVKNFRKAAQYKSIFDSPELPDPEECPNMYKHVAMEIRPGACPMGPPRQIGVEWKPQGSPSPAKHGLPHKPQPSQGSNTSTTDGGEEQQDTGLVGCIGYTIKCQLISKGGREWEMKHGHFAVRSRMGRSPIIFPADPKKRKGKKKADDSTDMFVGNPAAATAGHDMDMAATASMQHQRQAGQAAAKPAPKTDFGKQPVVLSTSCALLDDDNEEAVGWDAADEEETTEEGTDSDGEAIRTEERRKRFDSQGQQAAPQGAPQQQNKPRPQMRRRTTIQWKGFPPPPQKQQNQQEESKAQVAGRAQKTGTHRRRQSIHIGRPKVRMNGGEQTTRGKNDGHVLAKPPNGGMRQRHFNGPMAEPH